MEERVRGSNIICYIILRLQGSLSCGEEGKGTEVLGKKIKILRNGGGEEYQITGNFNIPDISTKPCQLAHLEFSVLVLIWEIFVNYHHRGGNYNPLNGHV